MMTMGVGIALIVLLIQGDPDKRQQKRGPSFLVRQFPALGFPDNGGV